MQIKVYLKTQYFSQCEIEVLFRQAIPSHLAIYYTHLIVKNNTFHNLISMFWCCFSAELLVIIVNEKFLLYIIINKEDTASVFSYVTLLHQKPIWWWNALIKAYVKSTRIPNINQWMKNNFPPQHVHTRPPMSELEPFNWCITPLLNNVLEKIWHALFYVQ